MRKLFGFVVVLLIVVFGLSFALLNATQVSVDYYLGAATLPLSLALVLALVIGALLGMVAASALLLRQRRENLRLRRRVGQLEKELGELRTLPVRDAG